MTVYVMTKRDKSVLIIPCTTEAVAKEQARICLERNQETAILSCEDLEDLIKEKNKIGSKKATTTTKAV
jgi:hypothetical protein